MFGESSCDDRSHHARNGGKGVGDPQENASIPTDISKFDC